MGNLKFVCHFFCCRSLRQALDHWTPKYASICHMWDSIKKGLGITPEKRAQRQKERDEVHVMQAGFDSVEPNLRQRIPYLERELAHCDEAEPRLTQEREGLSGAQNLSHDNAMKLASITNSLLKLSERRAKATQEKRQILAQTKNILESLVPKDLPADKRLEWFEDSVAHPWGINKETWERWRMEMDLK